MSDQVPRRNVVKLHINQEFRAFWTRPSQRPPERFIADHRLREMWRLSCYAKTVWLHVRLTAAEGYVPVEFTNRETVRCWGKWWLFQADGFCDWFQNQFGPILGHGEQECRAYIACWYSEEEE